MAKLHSAPSVTLGQVLVTSVFNWCLADTHVVQKRQDYFNHKDDVMARIAPPLFGSDWSEDRIRRFEEIKSDISAFQYESVEATLAFQTFKILNKMMPDEQPHHRLALIRIQETAIEIVCRRLLGERYRSGPPLLHREDTAPPEPMEPDRNLLIDAVQYWLDHESKDITSDINLDQLRHLEDALKYAQDDRDAIKQARRSRRVQKKKGLPE
jgi:hypothetical protein